MENLMIGKLLIAAPEMSKQANSFAHTVILVVKHNDDGAFGLCVNRRGQGTVGDFWTQACENEFWKGEATNPDQRMYAGGPCSVALFSLHTESDIGDIMVVPGIWFSARESNVEESFRLEGQRRIIVGYSGWSPGQLESELEQGAWFALDASPELIFSEADDREIWESAKKAYASKQTGDWLGINTEGIDPLLN